LITEIAKLFDLSGRVALVTGGSRGLGRAIVHAYARAGADVVIASRKIENCRTTAREVEEMGRKALPYSCHVGHWDELPGLVDAAYGAFGRVDILVNNAGMSPLAPSLSHVSEELFDKVIAVNFKGPFRLSSLLGPRMVAGGGGVIINVSSAAALRPTPHTMPYCAAKAALNAMTVALAKEYGPTVRVNTLSPGPFETDVARHWVSGQRASGYNVAGRIGAPEEIVTAALFLASPASSYTTGGLVRVDGGVM
jgi:NAD(P)-dependent dehydrogenase (short-subunit alcohol dehydrogenase family)